MIECKSDLDECKRMLDVNITRLCVSEDLEELEKMKEVAIRRINDIYSYNICNLIKPNK